MYISHKQYNKVKREKIKGGKRERERRKDQYARSNNLVTKYSKKSSQITANFLKQLGLLNMTLSMDTSCAISLYQILTFGDVPLFQFSNAILHVTNKICYRSAIWEGFSLKSLGIYMPKNTHICQRYQCCVQNHINASYNFFPKKN